MNGGKKITLHQLLVTRLVSRAPHGGVRSLERGETQEVNSSQIRVLFRSVDCFGGSIPRKPRSGPVSVLRALCRHPRGRSPAARLRGLAHAQTERQSCCERCGQPQAPLTGVPSPPSPETGADSALLRSTDTPAQGSQPSSAHRSGSWTPFCPSDG